tara:strand:- start:404 stop:895 length:492 start_codon:yes stop_codon:yes gene_type:complete
MDTNIIKEIVINATEIDILNPEINTSRKKEYVEARMYYYTLCREYTQLSLDAIAKTIVPQKNHATVIHGIRSCQKDVKNYTNIRNMYNNLRSRVEYVKQKSEEKNFQNTLSHLFNLEEANEKLIQENKTLINQLQELKENVKKQNKYLQEQGYKLNKNRTTKI